VLWFKETRPSSRADRSQSKVRIIHRRKQRTRGLRERDHQPVYANEYGTWPADSTARLFAKPTSQSAKKNAGDRAGTIHEIGERSRRLGLPRFGKFARRHGEGESRHSPHDAGWRKVLVNVVHARERFHSFILVPWFRLVSTELVILDVIPN